MTEDDVLFGYRQQKMIEERIVSSAAGSASAAGFSFAHPGLGPATRGGGAAPREVGRDHCLAQRCLEGALPPRAQHQG
jgi:hypothetical protein